MIVQDNVVIYGNGVALTAEGALGSVRSVPFLNKDVHLGNATYLNIPMPEGFTNGDLYYNEGEYSLTKQGLEKAIQNKLKEISINFDEVVKTYEINGIVLHSDYASITRLDAALRLSERANLPGTSFYDINSDGHMLTLEQANQIVISLAFRWQNFFTIKQAKKKALKEIDTSLVDAQDTSGVVALFESIEPVFA